MSTPNLCVACLGLDQPLLQTRQFLLRGAGYETLVTSELLTAAEWLLNGEINILVLCHTLPDEETEAIIKFHEEMKSAALLLLLTAGWWEPHPGYECRVSEARRGPAAFLAAVTKLSNEFGLSRSLSGNGLSCMLHSY